MELDQLKWWHWVLISLPLGWLLAFMNSGTVQPTDYRTDEQVYFERAILHAPVGDQNIPWVRHLVVYPVTEAKGANGNPVLLTPVTYEVLVHKSGGEANEYEYVPTWFGARVPYACTNQRPTANPGDARVTKAANHLPAGIEKTFAPDPDATLASITAAVYGKDTPQGESAIELANAALQKSHSIAALIKSGRFRNGQNVMVPWNPDQQKTVRDWLNGVDQDYDWIHYQYAIWKEPNFCKVLWMGGTFAVVGVLWPISITLLTGAGLGGRRVKKSDYDLARFGSGKSTRATMPGRKTKELDEAGQRQLAAMNQTLTDSLKDSATTSAPPPKPAAAPAAHIPTPLASEPLAPPPAGPQEEAKEFSGQFYPVAHPAAKPKTDSPQDKKKT
jgi:hypothetical protein